MCVSLLLVSVWNTWNRSNLSKCLLNKYKYFAVCELILNEKSASESSKNLVEKWKIAKSERVPPTLLVQVFKRDPRISVKYSAFPVEVWKLCHRALPGKPSNCSCLPATDEDNAKQHNRMAIIDIYLSSVNIVALTQLYWAITTCSGIILKGDIQWNPMLSDKCTKRRQWT